MAVVQEIAAATPPVALVSGDHVEFNCRFVTGGTYVNVVSPACAMATTGGTPISVAAASMLVPFSKDSSEVGRYKICFLSSGLSDGEYQITMSGLFPDASGDTLSLSSLFSVRTAPTIQTYINMVRSALMDILPQLYLIENPEQFLYHDGQLYDALQRSLNAINMTPPVRYVFDFNTVPWPNLLIDGAMIYALTSRGVLEISNTLSYNDEISFAIDRAGKLQSMAQMFYANWVTERIRVKRDYSWSRAKAIGLMSTRLPFTLIRTFSFSPGLKNTFDSVQNWGGYGANYRW